MSKKLIITVFLVVAILAGGLLLNKSKSAYNASSTPTPKSSISANDYSQIPQTGISIVVTEQNSSGQSGIATISELDGEVVVNFKLVGFGSSTPQPSHLHLGSCEVPGDVVYSLANVVNGVSKTTLDADMATFNTKLPLVLNVHKSQAEANIYTACGQVSP